MYKALEKEISEQSLTDVYLVKVGCIGSCYCEPTVQVNISGHPPVYYGYVDPEAASRIVKEHLLQGNPLESHIIPMTFHRTDPLGAKKRQLRIALRNCGMIDPEKIEEYIAFDGYEALSKVLMEYSPADVIAILKESGLRGRGGGGFPTGLKWQTTAQAERMEKYMICNAYEEDPGAYMGRSLLEGDPNVFWKA